MQVQRQEDIRECKAIELISGKELPDFYKNKAHEEEKPKGSPSMEKKNEDGWVEVQKPISQSELPKYIPKLPYPERQQRNKQDQKFQDFLNIFRKLTVNIPFAKALEQMLIYAKFMKQILSKKRRLEEFETVALNEKCSAILQKKLPTKLKDPGRFIIPCAIGSSFSCNALCDLGASINLMPLSIYKKLRLGDVQPTTVKLQLADGTYIFPKGEIENILVKVDKFIFLTDFVILEMEEDKNVPIIMGRPFLATERTLIDVAARDSIMRVNDE